MPSSNRYIWQALFAGVIMFLLLSSTSEKAYAMSQNKHSVIWASCRPETAKVSPSEDICMWFSQELSAAFPTCDIRRVDTLPEGREAGLRAVLVIQRASMSNLEARLDWSTDNRSWQHGQANGMAIADASLNMPMVTAFLRDLIKAAPPPEPCS